MEIDEERDEPGPWITKGYHNATHRNGTAKRNNGRPVLGNGGPKGTAGDVNERQRKPTRDWERMFDY